MPILLCGGRIVPGAGEQHPSNQHPSDQHRDARRDARGGPDAARGVAHPPLVRGGAQWLTGPVSLSGPVSEDARCGKGSGTQPWTSGPEVGEHHLGECRPQSRLVVSVHRSSLVQMVAEGLGRMVRAVGPGGQSASTAWMSSSTSRCVPTRERPSSTAWFQFMRKSSRLRRAVAVNPARTPPHGSGRVPL